MKQVLCALMIASLCLPAHADFAAGEKAFNDRDFATAWKELHPLAQAGDARAMEAVGCMYLDGNGVGQDYAEARTWFTKATGAGNLDAYNSLGFIYTDGLGVKKDHVKAFACYLKAAKNDNFMAQSIVAALYYAGIGTAKNPEKALKWFLIAVGNPVSDPEMCKASREKIAEIGRGLGRKRTEFVAKQAALYRAIAARKPVAIDRIED